MSQCALSHNRSHRTHCHYGELEKWEDWSWQLKRYVGLYKPFAKRMMDDVEASQGVTADDLSEAFDVQQTGTQNNQSPHTDHSWCHLGDSSKRGHRMALRSEKDCADSLLPGQARATILLMRSFHSS